MDAVRECPHCRREVEQAARETVATGEARDVLDQVRDLLDGEDGEGDE